MRRLNGLEYSQWGISNSPNITTKPNNPINADMNNNIALSFFFIMLISEVTPDVHIVAMPTKPGIILINKSKPTGGSGFGNSIPSQYWM